MSDFEDDEDFGLTDAVEGKPDAKATPPPEPNDDEDDIYGDIAGPSASYPLVPTNGDKTTSAESHKPEDRQLALVERQNSGAQAESLSAKNTSAVDKKALPKKLADTKVVYIGELEWWTTDAEIETLCSEFGPLDSVSFFEEKGSGKSKGYCLVTFGNKEAANLCRHQMNGMEINGRKCVVTFSYNSNAAAKTARQQGTTASRQHGYGGREQQPNTRANWRPAQGMGREAGMPLPPMPPWGNMGMGMPGLPMPGMGMPYMDNMGQGPEKDYKRRRY